MAALADRILERLRSAWGPLDDGELAESLGVRRQTVNETCRRLEREGVLTRQKVAGAKTVNLIRADPSAPPARQPEPVHPTVRMGEDEVRAAVIDHLAMAGFEVEPVSRRTRGTDIDAVGPTGRVVIEARGDVPPGRGQVRHLVDALVELVQRMSDPEATYGLALPDHPQSRNFAARLPALVRDRLRLRIYFVSRAGDGALTVEEA